MKLTVVGNGVAGVTTARAVREHDPSIEVVLYSDECFPYYPRPRLIDLLADKVSVDQMPFYAESWYEQRGIQTRLEHRVVQVNSRAKEITFADGSSDGYDKLVLATGAHSWVPPIPGVECEGVFTLRSLSDALVLRDRGKQARHIVILGGGLLGLDISMALCTQMGRADLIEAQPRLLPRQLDIEGAGLLRRMIEDAGGRVYTGERCVGIEGNGRVERIHLEGGLAIDTDMVVISAGVRPNLSLAREAGLACDRGISVNERLQTSQPDIYAVGDVAEFHQRSWGIIPAALAQARVAAAQIGGEADTLYHDIMPSTTIKVMGIDVTSIGEVNPEGEGFLQVRRSDPDRRSYKKVVVREGRVVGAIVMGDRSGVRSINQLIAHAIDVSAHVDDLLNEEFDLMGLVEEQTGKGRGAAS